MLKFGGTSLGSPKDINNVARTVASFSKYNEIVVEFTTIFPNARVDDEGYNEHSNLKSSYYQRTWFEFNSGDNVYVVCYDWSEETNMRDGLGVAINHKEYYDFLQNEAYK